MATGDLAIAAGMDIVDGNATAANTIDDEINRTRDYVAERTHEVTPVSAGGTGATTASSARTNLDVIGWTDTFTDPDQGRGKIMRLNSAGQLACMDPTAPLHTANRRYVDAAVGSIPAPNMSAYVRKSGEVMSGDLTVQANIFIPNSSPATSGYSVAYVNNDGRISRGASSERYKKYISAVDPESLGNIWPDLQRYQMRQGDGTWKYGYIAEHLDARPELRPFVVYSEFDGQQVPETIDFIALLMAQNAQLHTRLRSLAARVDALEGNL